MDWCVRCSLVLSTDSLQLKGKYESYSVIWLWAESQGWKTPGHDIKSLAVIKDLLRPRWHVPAMNCRESWARKSLWFSFSQSLLLKNISIFWCVFDCPPTFHLLFTLSWTLWLVIRNWMKSRGMLSFLEWFHLGVQQKVVRSSMQILTRKMNSWIFGLLLVVGHVIMWLQRGFGTDEDLAQFRENYYYFPPRNKVQERNYMLNCCWSCY